MSKFLASRRLYSVALPLLGFAGAMLAILYPAGFAALCRSSPAVLI